MKTYKNAAAVISAQCRCIACYSKIKWKYGPIYGRDYWGCLKCGTSGTRDDFVEGAILAPRRNAYIESMDDVMFNAFNKGEKDPNEIRQHEKGTKLDKGKPDASLLGMFGKALLAVAEVGTYGAEKYTRGGWESVKDGINRYTAAMLRHFFEERYEDYDTDLPVLHSAQVAWNALARLELILREKEK